MSTCRRVHKITMKLQKAIGCPLVCQTYSVFQAIGKLRRQSRLLEAEVYLQLNLQDNTGFPKRNTHIHHPSPKKSSPNLIMFLSLLMLILFHSLLHSPFFLLSSSLSSFPHLLYSKHAYIKWNIVPAIIIFFWVNDEMLLSILSVITSPTITLGCHCLSLALHREKTVCPLLAINTEK